jgi:hypothetical protein
VGRTLQFVSGKYGLLKKSWSFNYPALLFVAETRMMDVKDQQQELIGPLSFCCKCTWFTGPM